MYVYLGMCNNGLNDFVEVPLINGIISSVNDNTGRGVLFVYMCTYVCNVVTRVVVKSAVNDVWCTYVGVSKHVIWAVCVSLHILCGVAVVGTYVYTYIRSTVFLQHLNIHCTYTYVQLYIVSTVTSMPFQVHTRTYVHTYVRTHTYTYITYVHIYQSEYPLQHFLSPLLCSFFL